MKILITGGAGFIGSTLVKKLAHNEENEIVVLDSLTEQIHGKEFEKSYLYKLIDGKSRFIKADIRDYKAVEEAVEGCEYIIHLAAETGTGQSMYEINQYNEVNVMGTSNLFQALSAKKGGRLKKFILASSRSVYGEGKYECPNHGVVYPDARRVEDMKSGDFSMHCPICTQKLKMFQPTEDGKFTPIFLYNLLSNCFIFAFSSLSDFA